MSQFSIPFFFIYIKILSCINRLSWFLRQEKPKKGKIEKCWAQEQEGHWKING